MTDELYGECATACNLEDLQLRDALSTQLYCVITSAEEALQILHGLPSWKSDADTLRHLLLRARRYHQSLASGLRTCSTLSPCFVSPESARSTDRGRPRLVVNIEQVELLRSCGFTWEETSQLVGISRTTLWRRLHSLCVPLQKYSDIFDSDLDDQISELQRGSPNMGVMMLQGALRSRGIYVQRHRIRASVHRVNPTMAIVRWQQAVSRRCYSVPGPNSLWHVDGHHSLIRWRFVVHGCVDGFSRMVPYLACAPDNKAATVLRLFRKAVSEFGVPSRVRSDKGGENILVCHFMVSYQGTGRGSHIAGSSVHNQRIERLWRDVYRCVCSTFHEVFYFLEAQELLDPCDECDLLILHCVFMRVINHHLQVFRSAWNQHPLRTERNWSPHKIWINGIIDPNRHHLRAVREVLDAHSLEDFGVDQEGPLPDEQVNTVEVPELRFSLPESLMQFILCQADSTNIDGAVALYTAKRVRLHQLLEAEEAEQ